MDKIQNRIYVPGSVEYLQMLGVLTESGQIPMGKDFNQMYAPPNLRKVFDDYCDKFLSPDAKQDKGSSGVKLRFGFFLRVFKSLALWKKLNFESKRRDFVFRRRGALHEEDIDKYKEIIDEMRESQEDSYELTKEALFQKAGITEEQYEDSLRVHRLKTDRGIRIEMVEAYERQFRGLGFAAISKFDLNEVEVSRNDIIDIQRAIHKIQIMEINSLRRLNRDQEKIYQEMIYLEPKVCDLLYMQTGVEMDEFRANLDNLDMNMDPEFIKMQQDFEEILKQLYANIGLEFDFSALESQQP